MKKNKNKYEQLTQDEQRLFLVRYSEILEGTILKDYINHLLDCILKLAKNNRELLKKNMYLENELRKMRKGMKTKKCLKKQRKQ